MAFEQDPVDAAMAQAVRDSIQNASNGTDRSQQARDGQMGISNLGHCQQYAVLQTRQTEPSDEVDKTPAFFGTVAGDAIERQLLKDHPDWIIQGRVPGSLGDKRQRLVLTLPNGRKIPGTPDIVVPASAATKDYPQGVYDLKSKAEMTTIKKTGQTQQQKWQVAALASAAIDAGWLDPTLPIRVADVYFDRSGTVLEPFVLGDWYNPDTIWEIEEWVDGVIYAVVNQEDGMREPAREFCATYCEFFTVCRGNDTDATGLITDPVLVAAIHSYKEIGQLRTALEKEQDKLKPILEDLVGSTGEWQIRPVFVDGGQVSFYRPPYTKIGITKAAKPKASAGRKPKTAKVSGD